MRGFGVFMLAAGIATLAAGSLGGCESTVAYDRHWKDQSVVLASAQANTPLAGKWQGSWQSNDSDYYFGLCKGIILPLDSSKNKDGVIAQRYEAHFQLYHFWIFTEEFKVNFTAIPEDDKITFHGERILNPVDGVCRYDGFLDGDKVVISYNSSKDYGSFVLRRVTPESPNVNAPAWGPNTNTH